MENKLPPILQYQRYLYSAVEKFKIDINTARNKYGKLTIKEWDLLLKSND